MTTPRRKGASSGSDRIETRLSRIEAQLERVTVVTEGIAERLSRQDAEQDKVDNVLHGKDSTGGMVVRLDRLEQSQEQMRWLIRSVVGAIVTILIGGLWVLVKV